MNEDDRLPAARLEPDRGAPSPRPRPAGAVAASGRPGIPRKGLGSRLRRLSALLPPGMWLLTAGALPLAAQLQILDNRLPVGVVETPYPPSFSFKLTASGGPPPYIFSLSAGTLPAGLLFNSDGSFSGMPAATATASLTFRVQDGAAAVAFKTLTLTVTTPPATATWTARALAGGPIGNIAVSPDYAADRTLFLTGLGGEVHRSTDRGASWSKFLSNPSFINDRQVSLVLSPVYSQNSVASEAVQTVFVSSYIGRVLKSVDHGATFAPANTGFRCNPYCSKASALALSPNYGTDGTGWVAFADVAGGFTIYRTGDRALNWTPLGTITGVMDEGAAFLAVSPGYPTDPTLFLVPLGNDPRLLRSSDGGLTWSPVFTPAGAGQILGLLLSPEFATDRTLFVKDNMARLFRSKDGGTSFTQMPGFYNYGFAAVRRPAQTPLFYFNAGGMNNYTILKSDDGGDTRTPLYAAGLRQIGGISDAFAASPLLTGGGADLFAGTGAGIDISSDDGFSFNSGDKGVSVLYFNPHTVAGNGAVIFAPALGSFLKSDDAGLGWVSHPAPEQGSFSFAVSPQYPADHVVFIGINSSIYRSSDGGASFTVASPVNLPYAFAVAPNFTAASGIVFAGSAFSGLYKSVNGGQSFSPLSATGTCNLTGTTGVQNLVISPKFATDQTLFGFFDNNRLCKSTDGGNTWNVLRTGFSAGISIPPTYDEAGANGTIAKLVLLQGGSLRSLDGGVSFTPTFGSPGGNFSYFSPAFASDGTILAESYNTLLRSSDFGQTFAPLGAGDALLTRTVQGIYLDPGFDGRNSVNSVAVAFTNGSGVFRSSDGGRTFQPVAEYQFVSRKLTALARAPGTAPGTRMLAATADLGVFQSTDDGATFKPFSTGLPADANATAIAVPGGAASSAVTAISGQGLWRLNGSSWAPVPGAGTGTFTSFAQDATNLYAACSNGLSKRSADGGLTWTSLDAAQSDLVNIDFSNLTGPTIAAPPSAAGVGGGVAARHSFLSTPDAPAINTASLWSVSQTGGARYSTDSGSTWIPAVGSGDYALPAGGTFTAVRALGINAASGSREVLVGTAAGLFRTRDGGLTWRDVSQPGSGLETSSRNFSTFVTAQTPSGSTDILAGVLGSSTGGVFLSGDGGEHWTQVNQGFDPAALSITALIKTSCTGCPVQYYSGTFGGGVYTRTIAIRPAPSFPGVNAACFGSTACACGATGWSGPQQGGQPFRLCGANFQPLAKVELDGVGAGGCVTVSAAEITCTETPAHAAGAVNVRVRNPDTRAGYLPGLYTYTAGTARSIVLKVGKAGSDAALTWTCSGCGSTPASVRRSQNAGFTLNVETYGGGTGGAFTNLGALAPASHPSYFWSVE